MSTFSITRRTHIDAPPQRVLDLVTDLRSWDDWSPWEEMNPHAKRVYSGPARGLGATCEWDDSRYFSGSVVVTAAESDRTELDVLFRKPLPVRYRVRIDAIATDLGCETIWTMTGRLGRLEKLVFTASGSERRITSSFEQALAGLKKAAERR
ncbi:MAG: SRPBCC family protein [Propionibacteriaceae bacterium]|nr:SRPBCC family protein [Propionibacteriaceae bacterium]